MTKVFLIVSVACNVWFLSLLLYDRIIETKLIRFFRHIAGLWRSLDCTAAEQGKDKETPHTDTSDIIGKSRFKMASTRTTAAIPTQEAATSEKGIELSEEDATFDDGNTETVSHPAQVPMEKLDETFTSIPPSELEYGEDEPEDEEPDKKQASGSSFEDIDMAVRAIRKDSPSDEEMRHAGKVMTELDGTELFTRITERLTDEAMSERLAKAMSVFVDTVNMTVTRQKKKVFMIPDNIEEFDFRNYV
ncbi:conjugal transfer protein TraD [uncultured Bacteroides sp.]|uniref:conjugal transfer protein TraD n=1 Tax=uncultured Bacteroides sp. TaxID=162156 RepID=UPI00261E84A8|nr:conjugal transfer protein TraD [uncultured Bacteroides sp.]